MKDKKQLSLNPIHKDNPKVVLSVVKEYAYLLTEASERLNNDEAFLVEAIKLNPDVLNYIPADIKTYSFFAGAIDIFLDAIQKDAEAFKHTPYELYKKPGFLLEAVKRNGWIAEFLPITENNEEIINFALLQIFSTKDFIVSDNAIAKFHSINSKKEAFTQKQWLNFVNNEKLLSQLNKNLYKSFVKLTLEFNGNSIEFIDFSRQLNAGIKKMLTNFKSEQEKRKKSLITRTLDRLKD